MRLIWIAGVLAAACGGSPAPKATITPPPPSPEPSALGGEAYGDDAYGGDAYAGYEGDDLVEGGVWGGMIGGFGYGGFGYGGFGYGGVGFGPGGDGGGWGVIGTGRFAADPDAEGLGDFLPGLPRVAAPDPAAVYAVPIGTSPVLGPDTALVTIVSSYELADPFSPRLLATLDQLRADLGDQVRLVAKSYIVHPTVAQVPARAVCAAHRQDQAPAFLRAALEARFGDHGEAAAIQLAGLRRVAQGLGLEMVKWEADLRSEVCRDEVVADQVLLHSLGASAVPQSWINGRFLSGAVPLETVRALVDEELAKAKKATRGSKAKMRAYYAGIVKKGKTSP